MNRKAFDPLYSFFFNLMWIQVLITVLYFTISSGYGILGVVFTPLWIMYGVSSYVEELEKEDKELKR